MRKVQTAAAGSRKEHGGRGARQLKAAGPMQAGLADPCFTVVDWRGHLRNHLVIIGPAAIEMLKQDSAGLVNIEVVSVAALD